MSTPDIQFLAPVGAPSDYFTSGLNNYYWFGLDSQEKNEGELYTLAGSLEYDLSEDGFFRRVEVGGRWAARDRINRNTNFSTWGNLSAPWAGRAGCAPWNAGPGCAATGGFVPGRYYTGLPGQEFAIGGGVFTERSDASGTLLFDLTTGRWSEAMLAWLGIEVDRLAPIVDSTADGGDIVIGGTSRPSVIGGADTACVITALGLRTGAGFIAVGSGAQIVRVTDNTALDPATHLCACAGGPDSGFYRIGAVQNAGVALTRVLEILGASTSEANAALEGDIRRDDPLFLPYLAGERTPFMDPTLRGAWHGIGLHTDRQALLRSALEGIAHAVALACEAVTASDGPFEQPVMLVGGGTVDPRFRQLIADATGLTLAPVAAPDAAVLGAGLLAQGITHNPIAPELGDAIVPRESMTALLADRREHHIAHVRRGQEQ